MKMRSIMMKLETIDDVRNAIKQSAFTDALKIEPVSWDDTEGVFQMRMPRTALTDRGRESGAFHGGAIATLADTTACWALVLRLGRGLPTVNLRVDYLRFAQSDLTATATIRRQGRKVGVVDVDIHDASEKLVAVGRGSFGVWDI
ncbi:MAG: PaaI family thioesterase [Pseudomonadota bacterium]